MARVSFPPSARNRMIVALAIASIAAALHFFSNAKVNHGWSDFAPLWSASRVAFHGGNPYELIGPDKAIWSNWPMFYPATAFVIAAPFALIPSFHLASTAFVFVFSWLLAWGATRGGWQRLPIFPSIAFGTSAALAQWSIPMTAIVYMPVLGFLACAKPPNAAPVIASSTQRLTYWSMLLGGGAILVISLILVPSWPRDWIGLLGTTDNFVPPLMRFGGPLILIILLRWRRPESWLVLIAGLMPQTWPPYNGLILFTVARTYREHAALAIISSFAWITFAWFADGLSEYQSRAWMSAILNLFGYLPAVYMVMRRPNEGEGPMWLAWILRKARGLDR